MTNTFIYVPVRDDLIERSLETLYKNTVPNFYVYIIDQTVKGLDHEKLRRMYKNLMIIRTPRTLTHEHGNLGFAKACNVGIALVETPYFTLINDDTELIDRRWWGDVEDTFKVVDASTPDRPCMMVTPGAMRLPDWSVKRDKGDHFDLLPYKERYTRDDYDFLVGQEHYVNERLTLMPGSVIDGVTMYCSVFKTDMFLEVGMLPEQHYPGGGEDYWYNALANMSGYRCVGTAKTYIWHWWSKSIGDEERAYMESTQDKKLLWNNNHEAWGDRFDVWGIKCLKCSEIMRIHKDDRSVASCPVHPEEIYQIPESKVVHL